MKPLFKSISRRSAVKHGWANEPGMVSGAHKPGGMSQFHKQAPELILVNLAIFFAVDSIKSAFQLGSFVFACKSLLDDKFKFMPIQVEVDLSASKRQLAYSCGCSCHLLGSKAQSWQAG